MMTMTITSCSRIQKNSLRGVDDSCSSRRSTTCWVYLYRSIKFRVANQPTPSNTHLETIKGKSAIYEERERKDRLCILGGDLFRDGAPDFKNHLGATWNDGDEEVVIHRVFNRRLPSPLSGCLIPRPRAGCQSPLRMPNPSLYSSRPRNDASGCDNRRCLSPRGPPRPCHDASAQ